MRGCGVFLLLLATAGGCAPQGAHGQPPPERPGQLVDLPDGRRINLRCSGRGSPTVILESGFGAGAGAWFKVQPALARDTRVCAYDRAGYGFSDPGPLPRDGAAIVRDLDQALKAARIPGPYLVVGHSAGGLYARLFAARHAGETAGLVLLDPTVEQRRAASGEDGLGGIRARLQRCLGAAEVEAAGGGAAPADCARQVPEAAGAPPAQRVERWRNRLSELDEIFGETSADVLRLGGLLDDVPTYVITASETANAAPRVLYPQPGSLLELQHQALAAQFRLGWQRTVFSSHLVMIDRPDVVIDAARAMIAAARASEPPAPLSPSESELPRYDDLLPKLETPSVEPQGRPLPLRDLPAP